ncbi:MAG: hypothetical protein K6G92_01585 [Bacteroidaceae bacterium]|nr:hypothetical protein [Bacteroidaceae bacterium]
MELCPVFQRTYDCTFLWGLVVSSLASYPYRWRITIPTVEGLLFLLPKDYYSFRHRITIAPAIGIGRST